MENSELVGLNSNETIPSLPHRVPVIVDDVGTRPLSVEEVVRDYGKEMKIVDEMVEKAGEYIEKVEKEDELSYKQRLAKEIYKRIAYSSDYRRGKEQPDELFEYLNDFDYVNRGTNYSQVLMALEAKEQLWKREEYARNSKEESESLRRFGRREVRTTVSYDISSLPQAEKIGQNIFITKEDIDNFGDKMSERLKSALLGAPRDRAELFLKRGKIQIPKVNEKGEKVRNDEGNIEWEEVELNDEEKKQLEEFIENQEERISPTKDLFAFALVADYLLDVKAFSLASGRRGAKSYREIMRLLEDKIHHSSSGEERRQLSEQLVDVRKNFYRLVKEAIQERSNGRVRINERALDPGDRTIAAMLKKIEEIEKHEGCADKVEFLVKKYKGVGVKKEKKGKGNNGGTQKKSRMRGRLRKENKERIERLLKDDDQYIWDYALKGADLFWRRISYSPEGDIPVEKPIYRKRVIEDPDEYRRWLRITTGGSGGNDVTPAPTPVEPPKKDDGGKGPEPAPVEEEKPPSPKPAPLPEGENDTLPDLLIPGPGSNATPLPDRLVLGVVAMKQRIGEKDSMEVMEARAREIARKKIDEDREKYRGLFGGIKGFIPRLWKHSIGYAATYSKEKSFAIQAMAEAGVQLTGLPYEFLKELEDTARSDLSKRRKGFLGLKKVAGAVADLFHEASFTQKALHKEELELLRKLRKAAFEGNANGLSDELLDSYKKILLGDYQASEALARKISHEQGDEIIREAVGEKRSGEIDLKETPLGDFLGNFLKDEVIRPLLKEGLMNDGKISEETLFKVRGKIQGFFFSKEFINWYEKLPSEVKGKLDLSTSYGLDIVPFVQEVLLPTLIKAREHYKDMDNLDEYIDKLVLKTRLGTVEGGPKGIIGEGLLEKASSRAITNERVMKLYEEIKSNEKIELIPDGYLSLSGRRATILGKVAAPLATHITLGVGVGLGLYLTKTWAKKFGRVLVPVAGGTIVSGVVRSFEEWGRIGREWEEHMVDTELGYTFDKEKSGKVLPNRREQLDKTIYSMKRISDLATPLRGYLKEESLKDDDIEKMLGIIADAQARIELSDSLGYGLLSASNPQSYQTEMTDLEIALAEAKVMLKNKYSKEVERVFLKSTKGLRVKGEDKVGKIILALVDAQEFHLQKGAEFDPKFQSILRGVKIEKAESIEARKSAFRKLRARRVINSLAVTALGGLGVYGGEKLLKWGLNEALSNGWLPHSVIKHFTRIEKVKSPTSHVEKPTHVSTEIIKTDKGGLKLNLPKGYDVKSVDSVHHSIMISTPGEGDKVINYTVDSKGIPHLGDISKLGEGFKVREVSGKQEYIPKMIYSGITRTDFSGVIKDGHLSIELPPGYHESINGNELIITDDNHVKHVFNIVKDSHGKVIGIKGDPRSELKFHLGRPRITYESVHTKLGEQAVKIHEFISNGGLEKHHMVEVGRPAKVDFHVLWPEHARLTGEHAGHELEMHWGDGLNHTTGKWFKEKGVINFAGTINKHAVNPYLKGLSPRHDKVLEHLIDLAPDHKIDHQDMFVIMVTRTGKRIYAPLDKSGNFVLPEELRDPDNPYRPNPNFFKWIGIGVLEKKDHIISASEWLKKGGEPSMVTGAHEHILASLGLKGDVLPPVTEKKTIDLSFSLQKQLYEEKKVLIDVRVANIRRVVETSEVKERIVPPRVSWPDFALFVMPRRPLEAPIGVVDKSVGKKPLFKETGKTTPSTSTPPVVYDEDHKEEWRRRWLDHFTDDYVQRIKKATEDKDIRSLADQLGISEDKVKRLRDGENNEEEIRRAIRQPIVGFVSRAEFLNLYRDELKTRLEEDVKESLGEDEKEKYEKFEKVILYIMINKSLFSALSGGEIGNYLKEVFPDLFETDDKIDEFLKFFVKNIKEKANNSVIRFIKDKNDDYSKLISEYSS